MTNRDFEFLNMESDNNEKILGTIKKISPDVSHFKYICGADEYITLLTRMLSGGK